MACFARICNDQDRMHGSRHHGSGKSELLISWCLSLAMQYSPDDLHFVFLDFKGGSTFNALEHLPHTVGNVCDLDLFHAIRALNAIEQELVRREALVSAERVSRFDQLVRLRHDWLWSSMNSMRFETVCPTICNG